MSLKDPRSSEHLPERVMFRARSSVSRVGKVVVIAAIGLALAMAGASIAVVIGSSGSNRTLDAILGVGTGLGILALVVVFLIHLYAQLSIVVDDAGVHIGTGRSRSIAWQAIDRVETAAQTVRVVSVDQSTIVILTHLYKDPSGLANLIVRLGRHE